MTPQTPEQIARKLTKAQRECVLFLVEQYEPSPQMPQLIIDSLEAVRGASLAERAFMDEGPALQSVDESAITFRLSACWHYRLNRKGLQVRAILRGEHDR